MPSRLKPPFNQATSSFTDRGKSGLSQCCGILLFQLHPLSHVHRLTVIAERRTDTEPPRITEHDVIIGIGLDPQNSIEIPDHRLQTRSVPLKHTTLRPTTEIMSHPHIMEKFNTHRSTNRCAVANCSVTFLAGVPVSQLQVKTETGKAQQLEFWRAASEVEKRSAGATFQNTSPASTIVGNRVISGSECLRFHRETNYKSF